jgi:hypothetical protein
MLERLSLEKAMRLTREQPITVIFRLRHDIRQYVLLRYDGYSQKQGCHLFEVRTVSGSVRILTDIELGLRGDVATARFAEPECPNGAVVVRLRLSSANV